MSNVRGLGRLHKSLISETVIKEDLGVVNAEYDKRMRAGMYIPKGLNSRDYYYFEDKEYYYVPRYYSEDTEKRLTVGDKINVDFDIKLRDYQEEYFLSNKIFESKSGSFIMNLKTGNGKTICALWYLYKYQIKTLIVCETLYLVKQWLKRIKDFSRTYRDNSTIYNNILINNKTKITTLQNNDISIITLKGYNSLTDAQREYLADSVGILFMDEGHRIGAKTFYGILEELPAKRRVLLTATFRRKDGMDRILRYSFDKVYSLPNQLPKAHLYYVRTHVEGNCILPKFEFKNYAQVEEFVESEQFTHNTVNYLAYRKKMMSFGRSLTVFDSAKLSKLQNKVHNSHLIKFLVEEGSRRRKAVKLIRECVAEGRRVLIASPILEFMYSLEKQLKDEMNVFVLDGDTNAKLTPEELEEKVKDVDLLLGSMKVVREGMDIDFLDTLIIYFPDGDIEQLVGRITRVLPGKPTPKVFYFSDNMGYTQALIKKSQVYDDNYEIRGTFDFKQILKFI